ncbi:hypothetical protein [Vibrio bivalvicida]|uniref:hypothetical protein n=1 Tax=Vibrio bivalvicida TaxID=1276888 RepID=UPI001EDA6554|nr:hypothetical protein [Vibrio bivalvicida]
MMTITGWVLPALVLGATYSENKGEVIGFGNGDGTVTAKYNGLSVSASMVSSGIPPLHGPATWKKADEVCKAYNGYYGPYSGNKSPTGLTHGGKVVHNHENKHLWTNYYVSGTNNGVTFIEKNGKWVKGPNYDKSTKLYFHCFGEDTDSGV